MRSGLYTANDASAARAPCRPVPLGKHTSGFVDHHDVHFAAILEREFDRGTDKAAKIGIFCKLQLAVDAMHARHREACTRHALKLAEPITHVGVISFAVCQPADAGLFFYELVTIRVIHLISLSRI
jgi:hypothetical protein